MGKSVFKDLIREIKGSLGRFISIMAITAIGAAFFAGVTASSGDMKRSSDNYYDEYNMNDIRIISSIGLTDDDLQVIAKAHSFLFYIQRTRPTLLSGKSSNTYKLFA